MKNYYGGELVKGGFYFGFQQREILDINENKNLPGDQESRYWRIPLLLMLFLGPIVGLLYVIFLPFISFALVLGVLFKKAFHGAKALGNELLAIASTASRPGYSFLATLHKTVKKEDFQKNNQALKKAPEDVLATLEKEIVERRKEGQQ